MGQPDATWKIRRGTRDDIPAMIELDGKVYPSEWQVDAEYCMNLLDKNPRVYSVLEKNDVFVGYYSFVPVRTEIMEQYLEGKVPEIGLQNYVVDFFIDNPISIYMSSINVSKTMSDYHQYSKALLNHMYTFIRELQREGAKIYELVSVAITDDGKRTAERRTQWLSCYTKIMNEDGTVTYRYRII